MGDYFYFNLWEEDVEESQVEVKDKEQGSDELIVRDSDTNVIKKENPEDEKVEEFLKQPRDDEKDVDKPENLDSVFEDDYEKFPVEPKQDCDTADDSDSDVRRDDKHIEMVVIESGTDEDIKDRDEYLFGENVQCGRKQVQTMMLMMVKNVQVERKKVKWIMLKMMKNI